MNKRSHREQAQAAQRSEIEAQIRRIAIEREEYLQRANHLTVILVQILKQFGGEDGELLLAKAELDKVDPNLEGVNLKVGDRIVRLTLTTRIREAIAAALPSELEDKVECKCGGNASAEASHTEDCEWWKQHKVKPRTADSAADHKLCAIHNIFSPLGVPCAKCMAEATAQMRCDCGAPKYRHIGGVGACKDEESRCEAFRPKIEPQA
jgi:hypothetical protein